MYFGLWSVPTVLEATVFGSVFSVVIKPLFVVQAKQKWEAAAADTHTDQAKPLSNPVRIPTAKAVWEILRFGILNFPKNPQLTQQLFTISYGSPLARSPNLKL